MPVSRPLTTRLLVPMQKVTPAPPRAPAPPPAPMPLLGPRTPHPAPAAPSHAMLLAPHVAMQAVVPHVAMQAVAAQANLAIAPAQAALPVTPASIAAASAIPDGVPSQTTPGAQILNANPQPSAALATDTPARSAPLPTTVASALATIAQSAPSALAARQSGQGGGVIHSYDGSRFATTQTRPPAQGISPMSDKTFTRTQRRIYCPINSGAAVAAATPATITTRPQVNFQPDQLIVSPQTAAFFDITSWTIGITPQQAAAGAVSGDSFPAQNGPHFQFDVCDNGTDIIFNVLNNDTAGHVFKAMLVGYQVNISG